MALEASLECKVFVGGLPSSANESNMRAYFGQYGPVAMVELKHDPGGGFRGFAFVVFESEDCAERAIKVRYQHFKGKRIEVKRSERRGDAPPPKEIRIQEEARVLIGLPQGMAPRFEPLSLPVPARNAGPPRADLGPLPPPVVGAGAATAPSAAGPPPPPRVVTYPICVFAPTAAEGIDAYFSLPLVRGGPSSRVPTRPNLPPDVVAGTSTSGGGGGGGGGGSSGVVGRKRERPAYDCSAEGRKVFVGGLPPLPHAREALEEFFSRYGEVVDVELPADVPRGGGGGGGMFRGFAFVSFATAAAAEAAWSQRRVQFHGRGVELKRADPKVSSRGPPLPPPPVAADHAAPAATARAAAATTAEAAAPAADGADADGDAMPAADGGAGDFAGGPAAAAASAWGGGGMADVFSAFTDAPAAADGAAMEAADTDGGPEASAGAGADDDGMAGGAAGGGGDDLDLF